MTAVSAARPAAAAGDPTPAEDDLTPAEGDSPLGEGDPTPTTPAPNLRREMSRRRRDDIVRAAMEIFAAKGFRGGTLDDVAKKVGLTRAGVLYHVGSKENLLRDVLSWRDAVDDHNVRAAHGLDFFRHLVATARLNMTRPGIVQTYVVQSAESVTDGNPGQRYFLDRFTGLRAVVVDELRAIQPVDDPCADEELTAYASTVIALMDGLQVQWLLDGDAVDLGDATELAIEAIVAAVAAGASRRRPLSAR